MRVRTESDLGVRRLWIDTVEQRDARKRQRMSLALFLIGLSGKKMSDIIWYMDMTLTLLFLEIQYD